MIVGVLLAAGAGARFGGGKLLAPLEDGIPVGVRAARTLKGAVDRTVAVVRADDAPLLELLGAEGRAVLPVARASEGMGASLAYGVTSSPEADGWVVALADMPFVKPETVEAVRRALEAGAPIAAPSFGGRRGHPVGFQRTFYPDLVRLQGDAGARGLLLRNDEQIVLLECDDPGAVRDVDTVEDLSRPAPDGNR